MSSTQDKTAMSLTHDKTAMASQEEEERHLHLESRQTKKKKAEELQSGPRKKLKQSTSSTVVSASGYQTDFDAMKSAYKFAPPPITSSERSAEVSDYKERMAESYHSRLYHNYGIVDLSRCSTPSSTSGGSGSNPIGVRWRTKKEVENGFGVTSCGGRHCKSTAQQSELTEYEVPFEYKESGTKKCELVRVRLCRDCSLKLLQGRKKAEMKKWME